MALIDLSMLQTERQNVNTRAIDVLPTLEMCQVINAEDATVAKAIEVCIPQIAAAIDATTLRMRRGGRLIYVGAGTSGRLGILDASEIPPTFSAPQGQFVGIIAGGDAAIRTAQEGAEDDIASAISDLQSLKLDPEQDTLLGIAASGRTPYVLGCLKYAKELGCLTLGIACSFPSEMSRSDLVDHMMSVVTGPEVVTGSTRLKAGTGTKMALNMLSTGIMIKLGKTYGNMMVDLKASNLKLKQRSRDIVRTLESMASDMGDEQLDELIVSCNGSVKLALMIIMTKLSKEDCQRRLEMAEGVLSKALKMWEAESMHISKTSGLNGITDTVKTREFNVCIDGGGTKCAVVITDRSGNMGRGQSGSCNFIDVGIEDVLRVISDATQMALSNLPGPEGSSKLEFPPNKMRGEYSFSKLLAGIAGIERPNAAQTLQLALSGLFGIPTGPNLCVSNDVDMLGIAMQKYPEIRTGLVVIAGTGSIAMSYRRDPRSPLPLKTARSGGWGSVLGDKGGGYDVGKEGIQAVLSALDQGRITAGNSKPALKDVLTRTEFEVAKSLGVPVDSDVSFDFLSHVLTNTGQGSADLKSKTARVAQIILETAASDLQASDIASRGALSLINTLDPLVGPGRINPADSILVLAGGLFKNQTYKDMFLLRVEETKGRFKMIEVVEDVALDGVKSLV
ncbi:MAG: hypothetical protein M1818_003615 [Claussenomyces sp. TS43310]|nr:MAG: hypothetical protein M1818_003615 [Claussenomyces sp. TS43310]